MIADSVVYTWQLASAEARASRFAQIEPVHLLIALAKLCDLTREGLRELVPDATAATVDGVLADVAALAEPFARVGVDPGRLHRRLRELMEEGGDGGEASGDGVMHRSPEARRAFSRAEALAPAAPDGHADVRPAHLLRALAEQATGPVAQALDELEGRGLRHGPPRPRTAVARRSAPLLERLGRDLTRLAAGGGLDELIGRRAELRDLGRVLSQQRKRNAILVGEAGVGKTRVVEGLAALIVSDDAPPALAGKRLLEVSMAALVAGTRYRGDLEQRMKELVEQASAAEDVILFIDEIHTLVGAGAAEGAPLDAGTILKPALAGGELRCIGATTVAEYRRHIERDPALERRFQVIWVEEPDRQESLDILRGVRPRLQEHHALQISDDALVAAVELSQRYLPDLRLPDKALDLVDQACASARLVSLSAPPGSSAEPTVRRDEVAAAVASRCRVPIDRIAAEEGQRLLALEDALRARILGQEEAVHAVAGAIREARAGLRDPRRPLGVFLFAGPTGTGKTELAKALAGLLFDDERRLIRVDMSEFGEPYSVSRLIGAPPGYVGHDEEGQLTGAIRTQPYSVVLLDEIELAHPDVLNLCLQIFDEGHLTDARGRRASFRESIVVMTSNLGTGAAPVGFAPVADLDQEAARVHAAVRAALRPELLNRIDRVVAFRALSEPVIRRIIDKLVDDLRGRLGERRVRLRLTDPAYALLMREGFDPRYGARAMQRAVNRLLTQPLATALVEQRFSDGSTVIVGAGEDGLTLEAMEETLPARGDRR